MSASRDTVHGVRGAFRRASWTGLTPRVRKTQWQAVPKPKLARCKDVGERLADQFFSHIIGYKMSGFGIFTFSMCLLSGFCYKDLTPFLVDVDLAGHVISSTNEA